jgi:hypothetical protein
MGDLLALDLGREKFVRSVTALSPAGFWTLSERRYAFGVLRAMRGAALSRRRRLRPAAAPLSARVPGAP